MHHVTLLSQFGALMLAQVAKLAQETQSGELPWDLVALVVLRLGLLNEPRFWPFTQALLLAAGERGRGHLLQGAHPQRIQLNESQSHDRPPSRLRWAHKMWARRAMKRVALRCVAFVR